MFRTILTACGTCAMALAMAQAPLCVDESFQVPFTHRSISGMDFMPDGRILVAGSMSLGLPGTKGLFRLTHSGSIDPTFGPIYTFASAVVEIRDADYFFATIGALGVGRYFMTNGTIDQPYGSPYPEFATGQRNNFHVFPNGKQWRTGSYSKQIYDDEGNKIGNQQGYGLIQVLADGHTDPDFDHKYTAGSMNAIRETPDGRFLIGSGGGTQYEGHAVGSVLRVWPDGHLDTTFHSTISWGLISSNFYFYPDGRILVFGRMMAPDYPNDTLAVMRLLPDGSTDTTWPSIPFLNYGSFPGFATITDHLEIEPGKLIVVGQFNAIGHQPMGAMATIDTAGNVLWDYLPGTGAGLFLDPLWGSSECYLQKIKQAPDGFIYVCGQFAGFNDGCGDHPEQRFITRLYPLDVGVQEHSNEESISVYPNPGSDNLNVDFDRPGLYTVSIVDLQGRTVLERVMRSKDGPLDVSTLSRGMYTVLAINTDGMRSTTKWIKQ
ncbi:MAG: T9SS type A sorting domain-containing protein [Flavobacteriales bacterium]